MSTYVPRALADLDRIADALGSSNPSSSDWINWSLTLLGVAASTFVGVVAWRTSRRATDIADAALRAEAARDKAAYKASMTGVLSTLFLAVSEYAAEVHQWLEAADELETRPGFNPDIQDYPLEPSTARVTGHIEAARMTASGDDVELLAGIGLYVEVTKAAKIYYREVWFRRLIVGIRMWRDGTLPRSEFETFLAHNTAEIKSGKGIRATSPAV